MRVVIKLGTNVLAEGRNRLSRPRMIDFVRQIVDLRSRGHEVLLVSSGAIFAGLEVLKSDAERKDIPFTQVLASIGQPHLMSIYEQLFSIYDTHVAQALLTKSDLADREHYLNARNTLLSLLRVNIIPIINENDVVAIDEIKIGDNDNLSASVGNLVDADLLLILTDQDGLFTADPRLDRSATLISQVNAIDDRIRSLAGESRSGVGRGGMVTKIEAAEKSTQAGTDVIIASGSEPNVLVRIILYGESIGTRFSATATQQESRKQWILAEAPQGEIYVDHGAAHDLLNNGKSLFPLGVSHVTGNFERGQTVRLIDPESVEIARGVASYSAEDLQKIGGHPSGKIRTLLGYEYGSAVVHCNEIVMLSENITQP